VWQTPDTNLQAQARAAQGQCQRGAARLALYPVLAPRPPHPTLTSTSAPAMVPQWQWKAVMYAAVFLSCVSFAIVMPSLWPYLTSLSATRPFLAWVVAGYSVGEALGAVAFGTVAAASTRRAMVAATLLGAAGSLLYVLAPTAGAGAGGAAVLAGRLLQGMWTGGAQAVQQGHLAKVLPAAELTRTTVTLNAYACLGFVFGPVAGLVAGLVPPFGIGWGLEFNELTGAGYFVFASTVVIILLFTYYFGEDAEHLEEAGGVVCEATRLLPDMGEDAGDQEVVSAASWPSLRLGLVMCNFAFFVHFMGFAIQETITTPLVQAYFNWTVFDANLIFTVGGVASLLAFVALALLSSQISDRAVAGVSLAVGAAGFALLLSTPENPLSIERFVAGFLTISVAFPLGRATVVALYTKLLPLPWQGTGQGVILAVGAVARIIGPFWAVRAFSFWYGGLIVFGATAGLFLATLALYVCTYAALDDGGGDASGGVAKGRGGGVPSAPTTKGALV
jgi:Major Facilitator Superfamily